MTITTIDCTHDASSGAQTGAEMCEYIAQWVKEKTGRTVDPYAIWSMSPTGELWPVFDLYWQARMDRENLRMEVDFTPGPTMGNITWLPWEEGQQRVTIRSNDGKGSALVGERVELAAGEPEPSPPPEL